MLLFHQHSSTIGGAPLLDPTNVFVLYIPSRLPLASDDVVAVLDEMLKEHFSSNGDYEGGIVAAA